MLTATTLSLVQDCPKYKECKYKHFWADEQARLGNGRGGGGGRGNGGEGWLKGYGQREVWSKEKRRRASFVQVSDQCLTPSQPVRLSQGNTHFKAYS